MTHNEATKFRRAAARLNYLALDRPDLGVAAGRLSRCLARPRVSDVQTLVIIWLLFNYFATRWLQLVARMADGRLSRAFRRYLYTNHLVKISSTSSVVSTKTGSRTKSCPSI